MMLLGAGSSGGGVELPEAPAFDAASSDAGSISITWTRSENPDSFTVSFRTAPLVGAPGSWQSGPEVAAYDRGCTISLDSDTRYQIRVVATVASVDSAAMITAQYTRPATPTINTFSAGTTSISLSWGGVGTVDWQFSWSVDSLSGSDSTGSITGSATLESGDEVYGSVILRSQYYPDGLASEPATSSAMVY